MPHQTSILVTGGAGFIGSHAMQLTTGRGIGQDLRRFLQLPDIAAIEFEQLRCRLKIDALLTELVELRRLTHDRGIHELIGQLLKSRRHGFPFLE